MHEDYPPTPLLFKPKVLHPMCVRCGKRFESDTKVAYCNWCVQEIGVNNNWPTCFGCGQRFNALPGALFCNACKLAKGLMRGKDERRLRRKIKRERYSPANKFVSVKSRSRAPSAERQLRFYLCQGTVHGLKVCYQCFQLRRGPAGERCRNCADKIKRSQDSSDEFWNET